jgi:hypothetical protein
VHTPWSQTKLALQSFDRVQGAFNPLEGESEPPHPGSRESPSDMTANTAMVRTTWRV